MKLNIESSTRLFSRDRVIEMSTHFITSPDETCIAYEVTGHGPFLMLLHGAGKDRRDWHKLG